MSNTRIIKLFLLFFLCSLSLPIGNLALAETTNLGTFSEQAASEKFFKNITLKINGGNRELSAADMQKWFQTKEDLTYNPKYTSEIENPHFCAYKNYLGCGLLFTARQETHIQKLSQLYLNEDLLAQFLDDLARQTDKDPENAKLQAEDSKVSVFALSTDGIKLNKKKSLQSIVNYFKDAATTGTIDLAYDVIKPEISTGSIDNLGITSLIGEGTSNFAGSPKNRIFNIKVATNRFNGVLIKPGEEFSFVSVLGEVDGEHGYLPELVIKQDKTEPEFGGGICQVSTTAFRAAIYSGLKITARKNHAYPVSYYNPQGFDSTVYVPRPDLRFINNTPNYILIQTKIVGTVLTFDFYGTSDGRKTDMIGPKILERNPDGSMKTTFTQEVRDKDGNLFINDVFNSNYASPSKYPHPGDVLTTKPADWSSSQWKAYKKAYNL